MTSSPAPPWLLATGFCLLAALVPAGLSAERGEPMLLPPRPTRWLPSRGRECHHRGRYRHMCDGPRRAPAPHGPAADLAELLRLGTRKAAGRLLTASAPDAWLQAVEGARSRTLLWPVPRGRLGRGFGYTRKHMPNKRHDGLDIGADVGAWVRAANDGLVVYSDNGLRGFGNTVLLLHRDGSRTLYAHQHETHVFPGQQVRRGQVIGRVGSTGLSWGPHLHFEWRGRQGRPRNPLPRMVGRPVRTQTRRVDRM